MAVPITGNFEMFGTGSVAVPNNTTIAGAIKEGGDNVDNLTTFTQLIAASNAEFYDPTYAGTINTTSDISASLQFRNYPLTPPPVSTPPTTLAPSTPAPFTPAPFTPPPSTPPPSTPPPTLPPSTPPPTLPPSTPPPT